MSVDSFPFVVVERDPLVSPWLHTRAGERLTAGKFASGARDDADVKSALAAGDSCIVWEGTSADEMNRALVSHRAAWAMFNRDHAWVLARVMPDANPQHAVLADVSRAEVFEALHAFPDDDELLDGLSAWAVTSDAPEASEFRRECGEGVTSWLYTLRLSPHSRADVIESAVRSLEMIEFVERATPNGITEHFAMWDACNDRTPAEEFCQLIAAALEVVPTFVVIGEPITELLGVMFPERWVRWYVQSLAKDAAKGTRPTPVPTTAVDTR